MIDEEKYEKAKAMLEQQGVDISSDPANTEIGAGGVALPAAEGHQEVMERVEVCPAGLALVQEVTAVLQRRKGAALIIDYGAQLYTTMPRGYDLQMDLCNHQQMLVLCCVSIQVRTGLIATRCKLSAATNTIPC